MEDTAAKAAPPDTIVLSSALAALEGRLDVLAETVAKHIGQLELVLAPSSPMAELDSTSTVETSPAVLRLNEAVMRLDGITSLVRRTDGRLRI